MRFGFGASTFELTDGQSLPAAHQEMLEQAVLDILSGGRLILCAGTGYRKEEFAAYGAAAEGKRSRIRESLEILRLAWADEPFVYRGKYFTIPAVPPDDTAGEEYPPLSVFPKPMQCPIP